MADPPIPGLCPVCPRCRHRHLIGLGCWGGRMVAELRALVFAAHGDTCWLCGHPSADTIDHVRPRALGGTDTLDNLRPAHGFCNTGRGARPAPTPAVPAETSPRW